MRCGKSLPELVTICSSTRGANCSSTAPRSRRKCMSRSKRDRKSTRLNSSHGYISYAVFCLKKKTEHQPQQGFDRHAIHTHRHRLTVDDVPQRPQLIQAVRDHALQLMEQSFYLCDITNDAPT